MQLELYSEPMARQINQLYYITHIENLNSMLDMGILSHEQVEARNIPFKRIYDESIVSSRQLRTTPDGRSLWHFANLFFQARNAMLYRITCEHSIDDIAVLGLRFDVVNHSENFIALGNAAAGATDILPGQLGLRQIPTLRADFAREYWSDEDGSKRRMMAEVLVPDCVSPEYIQTIFVGSQAAAARAQNIVNRSALSPAPAVVVEPHMFFEPLRMIPITSNLVLEQGDLFFSRMQTLTVSVNTVGVMGKGLASRAKYQFPAVYVAYQDLCRKKTLRMGRPAVYKRETPFDLELADQPGTMEANGETWFLLFPTKRHWRDKADFEGIEEGLAWLLQNYRSEGIQSLAMPALGCGLGKLDWRDVGPLMCRYVSQMNIPVRIYLPAEKALDQELLTPEFLLSSPATNG